MKMGLFNSTFWGAIIILLGLSIILKSIFNIDIPFFRIIVGIIIIAVGIKLITSSFAEKPKNIKIDTESIKEGNEYNVIFGKSIIDLSKIDTDQRSTIIEINTIFGTTNLYIKKEQNIRIIVDVAFGYVTFPDSSGISFGNRIYDNNNYNNTENYIIIKTNTTFGTLNIHTK